jgi:hypothetical protein
MEKTQQGEVRLHGHAELMTAYAAVEWIMGFERIREDPLIKLPELEENLQSHINASESDNADWEAEDTTYTLDREQGSLLLGLMRRATEFIDDRLTANHMQDMLSQIGVPSTGPSST